jgi:glycerophosphoryl diester phosphodiesterase
VTAPRHPGIRPPRPLVFGHRGCALAPENTIQAFDLALERGADGLEMDVRLSGDGVPLVHHDPDLDRCTDGSGPLDALTAAQLSRLDAGYRFVRDGACPFRGQGVTIPRLEDVLRRYPRVPLIVEIKTYREDAAHAVVRVVRAAGAADRVCVAAFDHATVTAVRRLAPDLATSASRDEVFRAIGFAWLRLAPWRPAYRAVQVPEVAGSRRVVAPRFVRSLHRAGIALQVWTVNAESDIRRLLAWEVDGLITDWPDVAVRIRERVHSMAPDSTP